MTFYKSNEDLEAFEDYSMENRTYKYFQGKALYPFGYGMSYTSFEYSEAELNDKEVSLTITNTGAYEGDEVVQVYLRQEDNSYPSPIKELLGFKRIHLKAGEKLLINIPLDWNILNYWNTEKQKFMINPGDYELLIGPCSDDIRQVYEFSQ